MRLSQLGEFNLIKKLRMSSASAAPEILKGIGDDTAAVKIRGGITLITTDMLIEGIHFDLSFTTFYQLGYKALAVNISDILAMGGKPKYFLVGLAAPGHFTSNHIDELYAGMRALANKFKINIIGGDTCASKHGLIISGTLIGKCNKIIPRSGAKTGDAIFVTKTLGDSAMGLLLLKKFKFHPDLFGTNFKISDAKCKISNNKFTVRSILPLLKRHLQPEIAPVKNTKGINSMIDISDGLLIDLSHICDESKTGARIYLDQIPVSGELAGTAKKLKVNPMGFALKGGEDYALLFTAPASFKTNAFRIGEIISGERFVVHPDGREKAFKPEGYEHFKEGGKKSTGKKFK
ncbi:MAG: thiamine-phosphate kinase [Nitrospirae bacterium]|nr:thiamine-phosphate kinase [Nitrospirota bacterium]